jgi:prevent-host-death family protein
MMRRAVERDETIIVERGGKPMVVVMSIDEYERLSDLASERGGDALDRAIALGRAIRERRGTYTVPASEKVLDELRGERDAELDDLR